MADPNSLRRPPDAKNAHGKLYESRLAKSLGGRLQPNSGAMKSAKGDLQSENREWLIEAKTTVNATLPVELGWLVKISEEATAMGKNPAVAIAFVLPTGRPRPNADTEWVLMPKQLFKELTDGS